MPVNTAMPSSEVSDRCSTRYPVVLLHGLGYRDDMPLLASWGRVPDWLKSAGAEVYLGGLDAWAPHEANAALLKTQISRLLDESRAKKVNLVAHSKGGIEARFMISCLGMAPVVASLTTVCTPHRGTSAADAASGLVTCRAGLVDLIALLGGDRAPDFRAALQELTRQAMTAFNKRVRNVPGVYYRSYGAKVRHALDDPFFALSYRVVRAHEGENDGVVAARSCRWGDFRGLITGTGCRGISHLDMVDFHRKAVAAVEIPSIYVTMVEELRRMGL
jgi:triacylglycerol lipase